MPIRRRRRPCGLGHLVRLKGRLLDLHPWRARRVGPKVRDHFRFRYVTYKTYRTHPSYLTAKSFVMMRLRSRILRFGGRSDSHNNPRVRWLVDRVWRCRTPLLAQNRESTNRRQSHLSLTEFPFFHPQKLTWFYPKSLEAQSHPCLQGGIVTKASFGPGLLGGFFEQFNKVKSCLVPWEFHKIAKHAGEAQVHTGETHANEGKPFAIEWFLFFERLYVYSKQNKRLFSTCRKKSRESKSDLCFYCSLKFIAQ